MRTHHNSRPDWTESEQRQREHLMINLAAAILAITGLLLLLVRFPV